ncbi:transposase [Streptomyces chartreusis]|uniref:transposase n=1 Tax=Streptomyces chartreusis TaxID=1969 RepID=UPI0037D5F563
MSVCRPYRSEVSDARWVLIEPVFSAWRARRTGPGAAARVHGLREIVNAVRYVNRAGIPWEYLPHDLPPYKTVCGYCAKWETDGTPGRSTTCHAARPSGFTVAAPSRPRPWWTYRA